VLILLVIPLREGLYLSLLPSCSLPLLLFPLVAIFVFPLLGNNLVLRTSWPVLVSFVAAFQSFPRKTFLQ